MVSAAVLWVSSEEAEEQPASMAASAQAANQLTFKAASQPESNISVNVHAMEVSA